MTQTPSPSPFVLCTREGRIATISFNSPQTRNAIGTLQDCEDILAALEQVGADPQVSCLILTGVGSAFSAGGNLRSMKTRSGIGRLGAPVDTRANYRRGVQRVIRALWDCELPMIAAINGHAIGLGLDLACTCDLRIAADSARFASSFIKMGLIPGDGGAWILPRAIGLARASEMILTGDTFDAARMLEWGLVSQLVPEAQLMDAARQLAQRIVANPAKSLRLAKRLLREGQQQRLGDVLELSAALQALAHETADHAEAVDAFLDKRPPQFSGL